MSSAPEIATFLAWLIINIALGCLLLHEVVQWPVT